MERICHPYMQYLPMFSSPSPSTTLQLKRVARQLHFVALPYVRLESALVGIVFSELGEDKKKPLTIKNFQRS